MKERPILFSTPMVRAILDGSKTQTRRVVKPQPNLMRWCAVQPSHRYDGWEDEHGKPFPCPYGVPGDQLWVRETLRADCAGKFPKQKPDWYDADGRGLESLGWWYDSETEPGEGWTDSVPSIHMPRWASRITLEVTGVRVERLQDISEDDCDAEGYEFIPVGQQPEPDGLGWYRYLWDSLNAKRGHSWESNPFVWVLEFRRVEA